MAPRVTRHIRLFVEGSRAVDPEEAGLMICPRCGAQVAPHRKFCGDCGTALPWLCRSCGSENPAAKRFCPDCGVARDATARPADSPTPVPLPERRLITVMFVDLVGSTSLGLRLD